MTSSGAALSPRPPAPSAPASLQPHGSARGLRTGPFPWAQEGTRAQAAAWAFREGS